MFKASQCLYQYHQLCELLLQPANKDSPLDKQQITVVLETKDKEKLRCLEDVTLRQVSHTYTLVEQWHLGQSRNIWFAEITILWFLSPWKTFLCIWLLQHFTIPWENKLFGGTKSGRSIKTSAFYFQASSW